MQPDRVFEFEPEEARTLQWLPLAVRYKLDQCGLKLGLQQWHALALDQREALVRRPPGAAFEQRVMELVPAARRFGIAGLQTQLAFDEYVFAKRASTVQTSGGITSELQAPRADIPPRARRMQAISRCDVLDADHLRRSDSLSCAFAPTEHRATRGSVCLLQESPPDGAGDAVTSP